MTAAPLLGSPRLCVLLPIGNDEILVERVKRLFGFCVELIPDEERIKAEERAPDLRADLACIPGGNLYG